MTRPRCRYRIGFCPKFRDFRPKGKVCGRFECIELSREEAEALRLKNLKGLDQTESAKVMGVSQSSFQRVLSGAYRKVTEALIHGKAIKIIKQA